MASMIRRALSPSRRRSGVTAASMARDDIWLVGQPTREGARKRRPLEQLDGWLRLRGADRLPGARWRRSGARGVLELLLRAEQGVQHLLSQAFAERDLQAPDDDPHHEEASTTLAAAALLATAQGIGRVLEGG